MADPDTDKTQPTADKTANAEVPRPEAERPRGPAAPMLDPASRVSQEATRRTSENLELMKRLAETLASSVREASSETADWTRQAAERQAAAMREITQARSLEEVLDIQNRYTRENLQALLDLSAKVARLSADKADEASGQLGQGGR